MRGGTGPVLGKSLRGIEDEVEMGRMNGVVAKIMMTGLTARRLAVALGLLDAKVESFELH